MALSERRIGINHPAYAVGLVKEGTLRFNVGRAKERTDMWVRMKPAHDAKCLRFWAQGLVESTQAFLSARPYPRIHLQAVGATLTVLARDSFENFDKGNGVWRRRSRPNFP